MLWFRRDLRLADHPALLAAVDAARAVGGSVLAVFVVDRHLWAKAGTPRRAFLAGALADLRERLDGKLTIVHGDPVRVIPGVARHAGVGSVHVSADFTPYGVRRDHRVAAALAGAGVEWIPTGSPYAISPGRIRKQDATTYRVFTPFSKAWLAHGWPKPPSQPRNVDWLTYEGPHSADPPIEPAGKEVLLPAPTEAAAHRAWTTFRDGALADYAVQRERPDLPGTSRLSAYLHLGLLHPRTLLADLSGDRRGGPATFRTELCWREFYADVLYGDPGSAWRNYNPQFAGFRWDSGVAAERAFRAWQAGRTGFPIVDAGMRQLLAEGWMHNRLRMITASFLVKDLHLPWQRGARHFLDHLVDGDLASNNHGWQWAAGTGTDAAPYFRIFNPVLQGKKYDPDGAYVRRYVPELADVAGAAVHEPWSLPSPPDYPAPIVDHREARDEALRRYEEVRS